MMEARTGQIQPEKTLPFHCIKPLRNGTLSLWTYPQSKVVPMSVRRSACLHLPDGHFRLPVEDKECPATQSGTIPGNGLRSASDDFQFHFRPNRSTGR